MRSSACILGFLITALSFSAVSQRVPDLILVNGKVWTVDKSKPQTEAVAIAGNRILAVGDSRAIRAMAGKATQTLDLKGRLVLPGFIDNHAHFVGGGFQLQSVDLRYAKSEKEFAAIIADRARAFPNRWITGGDWDHDNWPGGNLPSKELVDAQTPGTAVFVSRYDGHMALANSYVLKLAGITKDTPDPPGGTIVKDPKTGEPTGVLKDEAMSKVYSVMPDNTFEEVVDAARLALREARTFGVTTVHDISASTYVRAYRVLQTSGELTARMYCRLPLSSWQSLANAGVTVPFGDEWIRLGSLKAFADGSLGSSTALFFSPYVIDPSTRGLPSDIILDGRLRTWALGADKAGLQLSIHAIGDSANSIILDLFEEIQKTNPPRDRRFRIEHAQHIHPKDFVRFKDMKVIASVQPYHAIDDGRWAEGRIGHERCETTYPFRSFIDNGVLLSFGSDWTVAPLNPLLGIYAAVTRRTTDGKNPGGWFPEQKITVAQAIEAYTINNAFAEYAEHEKGSVSTGKLADLIVLEKDILTIDPVEIEKVRVDVTMVDGRIVYERSR